MTVHLRSVTLTNGEEIAYREREGETAPLLFIHTNQSSSRHWDLLFEQLDATYHLIGIDLRGCGRSSYNTQIDSIADIAGDVQAFIEELDLGPVHLVGWSGGCLIAMQLEIQAPELVLSQTFISPISTRGYPVFPKDEEGKVISKEPLKTREELAADPLQVGPLIEAQESGNINYIRDYMETLVFDDELPEDFDIDLHVSEMISQDGFIDFVYAIIHYNISSVHNGVAEGTGEAKLLEAPALILYGDADQVVLPTMIEQTLTDIATDAALVQLSGVGHAPAVNAAERTAREIENFVAEIHVQRTARKN